MVTHSRRALHSSCSGSWTYVRSGGWEPFLQVYVGHATEALKIIYRFNADLLPCSTFTFCPGQKYLFSSASSTSSWVRHMLVPAPVPWRRDAAGCVLPWKELILCTPYHSCCSPVAPHCHRCCWASFSDKCTSVSQIRDGSQQQRFLAFGERERLNCSLWISWLVGLVGAGAGYHAGHVLPVTGADKPEKAIGKAAKPEIRPFSDA